MDATNPKRPRHEVSSSIQNPNSLPTAPSSNKNNFDSIISSLLSFPSKFCAMDATNPKRPRHEVSSSIRNPNSLPTAPSFNKNNFDLIISSILSFPSKFLAMDTTNPKRPRHEVSSTIQNPNSLPTAPSSNQNNIDLIISSLLSFPDSSPSLSSQLSISRSFDRALDKALASASGDVFQRTLELASLLHESTKRCSRKRASVNNSSSWPLPPELTIKMFSMLDTKSLMRAMSCCTMFHKYAMDPLCYSHINLTTSAKNVDNGVVSTMINRAGKELRFLELGHVERAAKSTKPLLTGTCLHSLSYNQGFIGKCLRSIHLYDIWNVRDKSSIAALSACSNITDLKIVGAYCPSDQLLKSLTTNCRFIEQLFLETYGFPGKSRKESPALVGFLTNIPNLTSLTLKGFRLKDATAQILADGARKLKYMDLSRNPSIKGHFLRDSGHSLKDNPLETLILRDCSSLEEKEVSLLLNSISTGNFRFIKHIDISNNRGMLSDGGKRSCKPNFPLELLKKERSDVKFVADFTTSLSRSEMLSGGIISSGNDDGTHIAAEEVVEAFSESDVSSESDDSSDSNDSSYGDD